VAKMHEQVTAKVKADFPGVLAFCHIPGHWSHDVSRSGKITIGVDKCELSYLGNGEAYCTVKVLGVGIVVSKTLHILYVCSAFNDKSNQSFAMTMVTRLCFSCL